MNRAELVKTLELVSHGLGTAEIGVPIFKCFCFQKGTVFAYNDHLGVVATHELDDPGVGAFAVTGTVLRDLLKNSRSEEVDFSLAKDHLLVTAGKGNFKLPFFTSDEFLFEVPTDKGDVKIKLDETLIKGLGVCLLTSSKDLTQEKLMGVSLNTNGKTISLYSCDGDAITRLDTEASAKGMKQTYMLPNDFCETLIKIFSETEATTGTLEVNSEWAIAQLSNGYTLYGRVAKDDDAFEFEKNIKATIHGKQEPVTLPMEINEALSRARVLSDPESKKTTLSIAKGKLTMVTETHMGVCRDSLNVRGHGDVEASVSAALVQRSIAVCDAMAVHENCCVFTGDKLFIVVSNLNE